MARTPGNANKLLDEGLVPLCITLNLQIHGGHVLYYSNDGVPWITIIGHIIQVQASPTLKYGMVGFQPNALAGSQELQGAASPPHVSSAWAAGLPLLPEMCTSFHPFRLR